MEGERDALSVSVDDPPPDTGGGMREWLRKHVLKGRWIPPTPEAAANLADAVHGTRLTMLRCPKMLPWDDKHQAFLENLQRLRQQLPDLIREYRAPIPDEIGNGFKARDQKDVDALEDLKRTIESTLARPIWWAMTTFVSPLDAKSHSSRWHRYVEFVASEFKNAMKSTNGKPLENSNTGPVSVFLAKVIPFVSDERPRQDAIMRYLQVRERAKGKEGCR
jgi:hypothetical protein